MAERGFLTGYEGLSQAVQSAFDTYWRRKEARTGREERKTEATTQRGHETALAKKRRDLMEKIEREAREAGKYDKSKTVIDKREPEDTYGDLKRKFMQDVTNYANGIFSFPLESWNREATSMGFQKLDESQFEAVRADGELLRKYLYSNLGERYIKMYENDVKDLRSRFMEEGFLDKYVFPEIEEPEKKKKRTRPVPGSFGDLGAYEELQEKGQEKRTEKKTGREEAREKFYGSPEPFAAFKRDKEPGFDTQDAVADDDEQLIEKLIRRLWPKKKKKKAYPEGGF